MRSDPSDADEDELEEEPEEEEPPLVYSRVGGDAPSLLASHALSAVAVHGRTLAVGTRDGLVVLLDAEEGKEARRTSGGGRVGTGARSRVLQLRRFPPQRGAVNDVGFDGPGLFVASASEGGSVAASHPATAPLRVALTRSYRLRPSPVTSARCTSTGRL